MSPGSRSASAMSRMTRARPSMVPKLETTTVSRDGKQLSSPKVETVHYENGRISYQDVEVPFPLLVLSRQ